MGEERREVIMLSPVIMLKSIGYYFKESNHVLMASAHISMNELIKNKINE